MLINLLWQSHSGSQPDPTAISGLRRVLVIRLGASAPAAPSSNFLFQQPTATPRGSQIHMIVGNDTRPAFSDVTHFYRKWSGLLLSWSLKCTFLHRWSS